MSKPVIHSLPSSAGDAARLAALLGTAMHAVDVHRFPDGELRVTVGPVTPTTIVYASLDQPNDKLLSLLFAAEALRRGGATRLVLLAPYLCYMRQDTAFHAGEAISQKVIGRMIGETFDRVITVDAHLHRTRNIEDVFPKIEAEDLSAMPAIADFLGAHGLAAGTIVVGPDAESEPWVRDLARRLSADFAVARKVRHGDRSVEMSFADPSVFRGRPAVLVDDIVSSGGTVLACAKALRAAGAISVDAVISHALFPPDMTGTFMKGGLASVRSTHSVPHPTNAIVLDAMFAEALRKEFTA
ncbi:MAG: ribose-phosphate pyrophosphokinase [Pseudolabrys sp.]|nr:ribose-phosphate pyrophosphokinase [Pseudolabrys sp.]MDP2296677.1 ribose-phosphate pyrophosphokinase [Pseudolabrys sp.]